MTKRNQRALGGAHHAINTQLRRLEKATRSQLRQIKIFESDERTIMRDHRFISGLAVTLVAMAVITNVSRSKSRSARRHMAESPSPAV